MDELHGKLYSFTLTFLYFGRVIGGFGDGDVRGVSSSIASCFRGVSILQEAVATPRPPAEGGGLGC